MRSLKLALIGVYPPPYGGISIHVQRLADQCRKSAIRCLVFDYSRWGKKPDNAFSLRRPVSWLKLILGRYDIIHMHISGMHLAAVGFCFLARLKGARFVLTYHSLRGEFSMPGRLLVKTMLKHTFHTIAMNTEIREKLIATGAAPGRVCIIPSYLPPAVREEDLRKIPPQAGEFIASHKPLISANAFTITEYQGCDLYGIDMCLELCAALKKEYPNTGLILFLSQSGDKARLGEYERRIRELGISGNFFFQTKPCPFYPVLMKSDIFVRPTNTDGDAISLREALHFKVPSVASDAVPRPDGTVIFRNRDIDDFVLKVKQVLRHYQHYKSSLQAVSIGDFSSRIFDIYRKALEKGEKTITEQKSKYTRD